MSGSITASHRIPNADDPACLIASDLALRFAALGAASMLDDIIIEPGAIDDYKRLARFHYRSGRPGAVTSILKMTRSAPTVVGRFLNRRGEKQLLGALVRSLPSLSCQLRDLATNGRYRGLRRRDAAIMLNREVGTISRVVIDPQWRGVGLAVRLVAHALEHPESEHVRFTEALAAMGRVSPFFQRAGMIRYERPPRPEHARLLDALAHLGIQPAALSTLAQSPMARREQEFLLSELRRWHRSAHRTPPEELKVLTFDQLLTAAREQLHFEPVYYLYQHNLSATSPCH